MTTLFSAPTYRPLDISGEPMPGATLEFYQSQTSTFQPIYADEGKTIALQNPVTADANGQFPQIYLDDALPPYKTILKDQRGVIQPNGTTDPYLAYISDFNQASIAALLTPITDAERAIGVTPVNLAYDPLCADRYGDNTVPGTTSMVSAFNAAIRVAKQAGGKVTYGATAPYLLDFPVDCTVSGAPNNPPVVIEGPGGGIDFPSYPIIAKHTGVAIFDCTGNDAIEFVNVSATTDSATYPKTGFLTARNSSGGSISFRAKNCYLVGSFSVAPYYNYGCEDDVLDNCFFENRAAIANTATRVYTGTNISGLASSFVTIATGTLSCIDHNDFGCCDNNLAGTSTSDAIRLESIASFKKYGGWMNSASGSANGRSLIYVDMTNAPSSLVTLHGVTGENSTHLAQYGILFSNHTQTPTGWSIDACNFPNATFAIATAGSNPTLDGLKLSGISASAGGGISITGTLQNSPSIDYGELTTAIGVSIRNGLKGDTSKLTVTTRTDDNWIDTGSVNKTWTPVTSALTVTGALTVSNVKCLYHGSMVTLTCTLAAATSIVCAAGTNLSGLPAAAVVRSGNVAVVNSDTPALIGMGAVVGSNIKLPAINVTTADVTITATYFVA